MFKLKCMLLFELPVRDSVAVTWFSSSGNFFVCSATGLFGDSRLTLPEWSGFVCRL